MFNIFILVKFLMLFCLISILKLSVVDIKFDSYLFLLLSFLDEKSPALIPTFLLNLSFSKVNL